MLGETKMTKQTRLQFLHEVQCQLEGMRVTHEWIFTYNEPPLTDRVVICWIQNENGLSSFGEERRHRVIDNISCWYTKDYRMVTDNVVAWRDK